MCQIQFIKRIGENLKEKDIEEFFKLMTYGSLNNNCAFGFFNDKIYHKNKGSFNLKNFKGFNKFSQSNFLIGHNRFATSGDSEINKNNHPFKLNNFILVHNGIISNYEELNEEFKIKSKIKTDSYTILCLLNHYFNKSKKKNRQEKIKDSIKKTTKKLDGSFSVFLYDKESKNIYYFKNNQTEFSFCLYDNSLIVGTTKEENLNHIFLNKKFVFDYSQFKESVTHKAKDEIIYLINNEFIIKEIGKFKTQKLNYDWESWEDEQEMKEYNKGFYKDEIDYTEKENLISEFFQEFFGEVPNYEVDSSGDISFIFEAEYFNILKDLYGDYIYYDKKDDKIKFNIEDILNY